MNLAYLSSEKHHTRGTWEPNLKTTNQRWDNLSIGSTITQWVETYQTCLNVQVYNYIKRKSTNVLFVTFEEPFANEKENKAKNEASVATNTLKREKTR